MSNETEDGDIEYDNDLLDFDYLKEKFIEDNSDAKEIEEEENLKKNLLKTNPEIPIEIITNNLIEKREENQGKNRSNSSKISTNQSSKISNDSSNLSSNLSFESSKNNKLKDDLINLKLKVKQKNNSSIISSSSPPLSSLPPPLPSLSTKEEITTQEVSIKNKFPTIQSIYQEKPKILETNSSSSFSIINEEKNKLPKIKKRKEEKEEKLQSIDILKQREEEILQAKIKRERLLKEQEGRQEEEEEEQNRNENQFLTNKKKSKKKKNNKEVFLLSFLFFF